MEQYLPPSGACLLGAMNLAVFVKRPFSDTAKFDYDEFMRVTEIMNYMLDKVVEHNGLPLQSQVEEILTKRRHGLGYYGLGTALTMMKIKYGSDESMLFTGSVTKMMARSTYIQSINLAQSLGAAPVFDDKKVLREYLRSPFIQKLELGSDWLAKAQKYGFRWTHGNTIAPTGTTALSFGNNCSAGIEPSFAHRYYRHIIKPGKKTKATEPVMSYEYMLYCDMFGETSVKDLPDYFITATDISPKQHLLVQAAAQKWIDSSISKTINVDSKIEYSEFLNIYEDAYRLGIKGTTTYRYDPEVTAGIYTTKDDLLNMQIEFVDEDGNVHKVNGMTEIEYMEDTANGATLLEALKTDMHGKY